MMTIAEIHAARGATMTVRNGKQVPLSIADQPAAHAALRQHFVVVDYSHFARVDVSGDDVFEFLDVIVSGDLATLRDGQALYTFILDEQGQIVADLCVLCDDDSYILLSEGITGANLKQYLVSHLSSHSAKHLVEIEDRFDDFASVLFEGPYSWEIAKDLFGMDVIGLPFMEYMRIDGGILFRTGHHGEFAYQVICDQDTARALLQDAENRYGKYNGVFAGLDFQDLARLENPCWDDARLGAHSRCPIELQLQWMVRYDKEAFVGKQALETKLAEGPGQRLVGFVADNEGKADIQVGQAVHLGEDQIGTVIIAGFSAELQRTIGQALLTVEYAYADIAGFRIGEISISTSKLPFARNFSFLVNPLEHSYIDPTRHKSMLEQWQAAEAAKRAEQEAAVTETAGDGHAAENT